MARGKKVSLDVQRIVVRMSALLSKQDIANYTGVSISSVERILWCFQDQNAISDVTAEQHRRSDQALCGEDVEVSICETVVFCLTTKPVSVWDNS
jgi:hypothetical protein